MAASRSRSRAAPRAAKPAREGSVSRAPKNSSTASLVPTAPRSSPAARERSVSRAAKNSSTASLVPAAAVIPAKANSRKAAASVVGAPAFLKDLDLRDVVMKLVTAYIPAWITLFLIEKHNLVGTYVAPHCTKMHGEKGSVFAVLGMAHLLFFFLPLFSPLANCSRNNNGMAHRAEMALSKVREQFGSMAAALIGAFVMQVPVAVTFTWVFTWLIFSDLYFLAMLLNCEHMIRYTNTVSCFAISFLHYAFIKLKIIK